MKNMTNTAMLKVEKMTGIYNRRMLKGIKTEIIQINEPMEDFEKAQNGGKLLTRIIGKVARLDTKISIQTRKYCTVLKSCRYF